LIVERRPRHQSRRRSSFRTRIVCYDTAAVPHVVLLLSFTTWLSLTHSTAPPGGAVARELWALEHALAATLHTRDDAAMEALLDDEFVLRSEPDVGRRTWIENALTRCWGDRFAISGFKADDHGDVRIATFGLTMYVNPMTCQAATIRSVITDVWIARGGAWRLRVRHSGPPIASSGVVGQYGVTPQPAPTWKLDSELSFVSSAGNTSTQTLGLASDLVHQGDGSTTRAQASFVSTTADGVARARSVDLQGRHGVDLREGLAVFGRFAYARDRFAGIDGRVTLESGVAYTALDSPAQTLTLETGLGITSESLTDAADRRFAVATGALAYSRTIRPGIEVRDELGLNADLVSGRNWRMRNALAFQAAINRLLSIKLSQVIDYRHDPAPGFGRMDRKTSAALVFSFKKIRPL
jgi:putative salt-induced outer membrane protein YdiY